MLDKQFVAVCFSTARRKIFNFHDSEDCAQEILLNAVELNLPERSKTQVFVSWRAIDYLRKQKTRYTKSVSFSALEDREGEMPEFPSFEIKNSDQGEGGEEADLINFIVNNTQLNMVEKEIIFYKYYLSCDHTEIGERIGKTRQEVQHKVQWILKKLRASVKELF